MEILKCAALVAVVTILSMGHAFAQAQKNPPKGCKISYENCVSQGMSKGHSRNSADRFCSRRPCNQQ
jgi:hypothetical protein